MKTFLPLAVGLAGFALNTLFGVVLTLTGLIAGLKFGVKKTVRENPRLNIKVSRKAFVHSKMYIVDGSYAVVGSANLTKSGLWENIETVTIYRDPEEVEEVKRDYLKIWIMA